MEVLAQPEYAPGTIGFETNPEIIGDQLAVFALQFVAGRTVNHVHAEMLAPILPPFGFVKALHHENEFLDVLWDGGEPLIIFRGVLARAGGEQLDDGTERTLAAQDRAVVLLFT